MRQDIGRFGRTVHDGDDDGPPGDSLASRVDAERARRGMSLEELHRTTGLSTRTLRDIEGDHQTRRYTRPTLARLDEAFGWAPGTAWTLWTARTKPVGDVTTQMRDAIAEQMALLNERLARIEETPPWQSEVLDGMRLLRPEHRALVVAIIRALGEGATWR